MPHENEKREESEGPVGLRERKLLMQKVQELGTTEHEEIFKILKMRDVEHSINKNGVFVNLTHMSDDVFHMLNNFVNFCIDNKSTLDEYDKAIIDRKLLQQQPQKQVQTASSHLEGGALSHTQSTAADHPPQKPSYSLMSMAMNMQSSSTAMKAIRCDNTKFNQAKKKYAKKRSLVANNEVTVAVKKGDVDSLANELSTEPFLIN
jgi:hypothetical protein